MAYGVQLIQLVAQVKAESGLSSRVSVGVDREDEIKQMIRRTQAEFYLEYDWPHMRVTPSKTLAAGQRYYDMPATLNFDRITDVRCVYSGTPNGIDRGISLDDYAAYDSDSDERADPVLKWDLAWTGSATQIEVWPIPSSNDMKLLFEGIRPLRNLTANEDLADLDDTMLTLSVAAEILARQKSRDAQLKAQRLSGRLTKVKSSLRGAEGTIAMGQGAQTAAQRKPSVIRVS